MRYVVLVALLLIGGIVYIVNAAENTAPVKDSDGFTAATELKKEDIDDLKKVIKDYSKGSEKK